MTASADLAAAARLGQLAAQAAAPDAPQALPEAAGLVGQLLRSEAVALVRVGLTGEGELVASRGYAGPVAHALTAEFPRTPWMAMVAGALLPPSLSMESERTYRDGWFYRERMEPSGFRDGMTGPLRDSSGRVCGLVHVSSERERRFGGPEQLKLAALLPSLALLLSRAGLLQGRSEDARAREVSALLASGRTVTCWVFEGGCWLRLRLSGGQVAVTASSSRLPRGLTPRELEVLTGLALGYGDAEIAEICTVSLRTVHAHVDHLRVKLGAASRTAAAGIALREGLLSLTLPVAPSLLASGLAVDL